MSEHYIKVKKINTSTFFRVSRILRKMGVKDDVQKVKDIVYERLLKAKKFNVNFSPEEVKKIEDDANLDLIIQILSNMESVEQEVYELISSITNLSAEQVADLGIDDWKYIYDEVRKQINITSFLSKAAQ